MKLEVIDIEEYFLAFQINESIIVRKTTLIMAKEQITIEDIKGSRVNEGDVIGIRTNNNRRYQSKKK